MNADKPGGDTQRPDASDANAITHLEGEAGIPSVAQPNASNLSWKGIIAVSLLLFSLVAVGALTIHRALSSQKQAGDAESRLVANRPAAAATDPRIPQGIVGLFAPTMPRPGAHPCRTYQVG